MKNVTIELCIETSQLTDYYKNVFDIDVKNQRIKGHMDLSWEEFEQLAVHCSRLREFSFEEEKKEENVSDTTTNRGEE